MTLSDEQERVATLDRALPILSIRQPWAWLILHAGKDIENRQWATRVRGPFYVHASKGCARVEYEDAADFASLHCGWTGSIPPLVELPRGGVVGRAEIVDCVRWSGSRWFVGDYGFVLRNAQSLDFVPLRGNLGFFRAPPSAP